MTRTAWWFFLWANILFALGALGSYIATLILLFRHQPEEALATALIAVVNGWIFRRIPLPETPKQRLIRELRHKGYK